MAVILKKSICSNCVYKENCKYIRFNKECEKHKTPHQKKVEERNSSSKF